MTCPFVTIHRNQGATWDVYRVFIQSTPDIWMGENKVGSFPTQKEAEERAKADEEKLHIPYVRPTDAIVIFGCHPVTRMYNPKIIKRDSENPNLGFSLSTVIMGIGEMGQGFGTLDATIQKAQNYVNVHPNLVLALPGRRTLPDGNTDVPLVHSPADLFDGTSCEELLVQ